MSVDLVDEPTTNEYIRTWLAETDCGSAKISVTDAGPRPRTRTCEHHRNRTSKQNDLVIPITSIYSVKSITQQSPFEDGHTVRRPLLASEHPRQRSPESSYSPKSKVQKPNNDTDDRHAHSSDVRPTGRGVEQSKGVGTAVDPSTKYEKRARHKAKSDKYDYKGEVEAKKNRRKRKRTRPEHVGKEDFHADNIHVERVSLKPNCEEFVFSQSKMSIPLAGHDLPDLTFPKMEFLSRPRCSTHQGSMKTFDKRDRNDDDQRRNRKGHIEPKTAITVPNSQRISDESDSRFERQPDSSSRDSFVRVSRSVGGRTETPRSTTGRPYWVRSEVDPRLETYQSASASVRSNSPVSWSTSPVSRRPGQAVTVLPSQEQNESEKILPGVEAPANKARSAVSDDVCDGLTQRLLHRHAWPVTTASHQDNSKRYQSLEDLKSMSDKMTERRSSDDLPLKRPNPLHSRPRMRLGGSTEAGIVHRSPVLYTDDIIRPQYDESPSFLHAVRQQLTRGHEPLRYDGDFALSDGFTTRAVEDFAHTTNNNITERPYSPDETGENHEQQYLPIQPAESRPAWVKGAEIQHEENTGILKQDMTYSRWNEGQLDEFDLQLLKTARSGTIGRESPPIADFSRADQESSAWLRPHGQAYLSSGILSPPTLFGTNELASDDLVRTRNGNEVLAIDRPSLQYRTRSGFNPFRSSWMLV